MKACIIIFFFIKGVLRRCGGIEELGHGFRKSWDTCPGRVLQIFPASCGGWGGVGAWKFPAPKITAAAAGMKGMGQENICSFAPSQICGVWATSGYHQHGRGGVLIPLGWIRDLSISDCSKYPARVWSRVSFHFLYKRWQAQVTPAQPCWCVSWGFMHSYSRTSTSKKIHSDKEQDSPRVPQNHTRSWSDQFLMFSNLVPSLF